MAADMSTNRAAAIRMTNQGLATRPAKDPRAAALVSAGIQAQDLWASRLAVRARSGSAVLADVTEATATPTVTRSWLMRGTLHMVAADDLRWLNALIGPAVLKMAEPRFNEVGLSPAIRDRVRGVLPDLLTGRSLTRAELVAAVHAHVPDLPVEGQARAHLTVWAAASGLITRAAEQASEPTYALIDDWLPPQAPMDEDDALRALLRRYFRAFGPATVEDFAIWSRLLISAARRAMADIIDEFQTVDVNGHPHYFCDDIEPARRVLRLLPAFDSYLLGYRSRDYFLDPSRRGDILVGGIIHPSIVVDGIVVGTWRLERTRRPVTVRAEFFTDPVAWQHGALAAEADDLGRFLGRPVELQIVQRIGQTAQPSSAEPSSAQPSSAQPSSAKPVNAGNPPARPARSTRAVGTPSATRTARTTG